jgi:two-component system sensor histidine kinase ChvG
LTPADLAAQLQSFSIASLHERRDEIGSLHKNLLKLTDQVTVLFAEKEQFAAEVSHELKNPIASIIAYSENLQADVPTNVAGNLKKIKAQAERMNHLVSEISEAAVVDNDLVTKKRVRFDLREVAREIGDHYQNTNLYPQVVIDLDLPSKAPMNGLPDRVGQVLVNLLDNAVSFARPKGTVRIRVQSHWRKGPTLTVEDSGPGVREEMRDAVFSRFFTSRAGEAAKPNSSGLGLHICKQIVEAHGGTITISESDLGGAKFDIFWR